MAFALCVRASSKANLGRLQHAWQGVSQARDTLGARAWIYRDDLGITGDSIGLKILSVIGIMLLFPPGLFC